MSDSTQQYILKQPITIQSKFEDYKSYPSFVASNSEHAFELPKCPFDEVFVPLDIPAIQKQLDQIIEDSVDLGALLLHAQVKKELTLDECVERQKVQISDAVNQIKSLFGLENKETEE